MRLLLCKRNLGALFLAALTAGTFSVSAVAAQSTPSTQSKKTAHKSHSSATHTTSSSPAGKSTHTGSSKSSSKKRTKKVKGQAAPTPERINEIQEALARKGTYTGTPTGKWDDSTVDAMKHFQSAHGLNPSGKLDALTLQKLGLGSETAGLAAPTPPPNSANRLMNTSSEPSN